MRRMSEDQRRLRARKLQMLTRKSKEAFAARDEAIREAVQAGMPIKDVMASTGLGRSAVYKISSHGPPPEGQ